jgi:hypothetical protein
MAQQQVYQKITERTKRGPQNYHLFVKDIFLIRTSRAYTSTTKELKSEMLGEILYDWVCYIVDE